jgi:hypothetical protein
MQLSGEGTLSISEFLPFDKTLSMEQTARLEASFVGGANDSVVVPRASPQSRAEVLQDSKASPAARLRQPPMRLETDPASPS